MQTNPQQNEAVYVTKAQASFTELLAEREAIILDLDNLHYYTLNAPAIFLWKQLGERVAQTASTLARRLATAFNLNDDTQAERDVCGFLDELRGFGLIETSSASAESLAPSFFEKLTFGAYETPQLKLSNSLSQVVLSGSSTIATAAIATG
jgi:Coenzyme PQQ synthesis protein D (PqqD)